MIYFCDVRNEQKGSEIEMREKIHPIRETFFHCRPNEIDLKYLKCAIFSVENSYGTFSGTLSIIILTYIFSCYQNVELGFVVEEQFGDGHELNSCSPLGL